MTASNEHPDMSGFPDLSIYTCHHCGRDVKEDRVFGSELDDTLSFCGPQCVEDYEFADSRFELNILQCISPACQSSGSCGVFVNNACPECGGSDSWMIDPALIDESSQDSPAG